MSMLFRLLTGLFLAMLLAPCAVQAARATATAPATHTTLVAETAMPERFYIRVGATTLTARFAANSSADALRDMLRQGDVTVQAHDYGNFEKVGDLGRVLPTNDAHITTEAGDIILYLGRRFVLYYAENTWNFTRLGKVENTTGAALRRVLGAGDVTLVLSLTPPR